MNDSRHSRQQDKRPALASPSGWAGAFGSVFGARVLSSGATFLTIALAGRALGRGQYGELIVLLSVMKVAAELLGPALDTALVRFGARFHGEENDDALSYYRVIFQAKLLLALSLVLGGALLAWPLAHLLSESQSRVLVSPAAVAVAMAGAACMVLWAFAQACFQAKQRFGPYARLELLCSLVRLALVAVLIACGMDRVTPILAAYAAAPAFAAVVAWRYLPSGLFGRRAAPGSVWGEVLHFAKWVLVACCFTSLAQRVDVFLLAFLGQSPEAIGDYGAALQLTLLGDLVIVTLFNVLLPKASALKSAAELRLFLSEFRRPTLAAFLAVVPLALGSRYLARFTFGPEFTQAGGLFAVLVLGAVFAFGCAPAGAALYGMGGTRSIAALEGGKFLGVLVVGSLMVRLFGVYGMAWTVAAAKGMIGIVTYAVAVRRLRTQEVHAPGEAVGSG